jgi:predicted metal-dependent hydrolase
LPSSETGSLKIGAAEVGYTLQRKAKRGITIYIEPPGRLRLVVPKRANAATVFGLLENKRKWIEGKLAAMAARPMLAQPPKEFREGETAYYLGNQYSLRITHDTRQPQGCRIENENLVVNLPDTKAGEDTRHEVRLELLLWYKKRAKEILKERTDFWSRELGLRYGRFAVGNPVRQWGSCSARNDIRYNWRVVTAPMDIIDYLVVHELCHVRHKDHSSRFWHLLSQAIPDYKRRRKYLKSLDAGFTL